MDTIDLKNKRQFVADAELYNADDSITLGFN